MCLDDEGLVAATGVSLRQLATVRKSLASQGLVQWETVRGRGKIYRFPAPDSTPPGAAVITSEPVEAGASATVPQPPVPSAGTVKEPVNDQAAVLAAEMLKGQMRSFLQKLQDLATPSAAVITSESVAMAESATAPEPPPPDGPFLQNLQDPAIPPAAVITSESVATGESATALEPPPPDGPFLQNLQDPAIPPAAVITSESVATAESATAPELRPATSLGSVNEQISLLVAEMMAGTMPDRSYLQELQKLVGGPDLLLECLLWMVGQVDFRLRIPRYRFTADGRSLLASAIEHLSRSPESPFLAEGRAKECQSRQKLEVLHSLISKTR